MPNHQAIFWGDGYNDVREITYLRRGFGVSFLKGCTLLFNESNYYVVLITKGISKYYNARRSKRNCHDNLSLSTVVQYSILIITLHNEIQKYCCMCQLTYLEFSHGKTRVFVLG